MVDNAEQIVREMARNSLLRSSFLRHVVRNKQFSHCFSSTYLYHDSSHDKTLISPNSVFSPLPSKPFSNTTTSHHFSQSFLSCRTLSSSSGSSNIVAIKSEKEFNSSMSKVQDESLPAIFYYTAVWCGPCRFISPVIEELGKKYPHVTTYKIDIDQEDLQSTLSKLMISSVPTLHFFQNGKKATEIIGADIDRLKATMENLYK